MPAADADKFPSPAERAQVVAWFQALRDDEIVKHAGDPGLVLARRLSNAEYNYTIRDLTGVDIRPTREFPVDPTNPAGFDNSGESLSMSPALLNKYLQAAREVANHMVLKPEGIAFAPHPMVVDTDRDKYCVLRIVDFYRRQKTDYARLLSSGVAVQASGRARQARCDAGRLRGREQVSAKYLATVWATSRRQRRKTVGPLAQTAGDVAGTAGAGRRSSRNRAARLRSDARLRRAAPQEA